MFIKTLEIENFRAILELNINFLPQINVLVGINGSGKSTILDSIAVNVSWLINRIQRSNATGKPIPENSIKNGEEYSSVKITICKDQKDFSWQLAKTQKYSTLNKKSDLGEVSELSTVFQEYKKKINTLPIIVYYPVDRNVNSISTEIKGKDSIYTLDVYDNALGGKANYQSFFEWFRIQDDIINEQAQSRSKWMFQNKKWIKTKINKLIKLLTDNLISEDENHQEKDEIDRFTNLIEKGYILEDPRYIFHELVKLSELIHFKNRNDNKISHALQDVEYFFHKMSVLSETKNEIINKSEQIPFYILERIFNEFSYNNYNENEIAYYISFVWETIIFSVLLSFWWISDKGKKEIEKIFKEFHPIKKQLNRFELEMLSNELSKDFNVIINKEFERKNNASLNEYKELNYVIKAIESFIPEYTNLRVTRSPSPQMLIDKNDTTLSLEQLSDGEKNLVALVGDIARRLSIANPTTENPLKGEGIILIDEIDLHLHPSWQRMIITKMSEVFPNCQFIVSTHSPQILSHVKPDNIFLLNNSQKGIFISKPTQSYGLNSDRILEDIMIVDARPNKEKIHKLYVAIQNNEIEFAKQLITELQHEMNGDDPELIKANVLIKRKNIIGK